ncbi:MAG: TatD family hydrolase [Planctomycetota bacterium]|nr:TatD family hydrolase [Planctomycetota bacterium]
MRFVDTHAHLDFPEYASDLEAVIGRAQEAGVRRIVTIGTDLESCRKALSIAERYPDIVRAALGIHPHDAGAVDASVWPELERLAREPRLSDACHPGLAREPRVAGIGETGLDYFKKLSPPDKQKEAFRKHLEIAAKVGKPVIVHCRDAYSDCYSILTESGFYDVDEARPLGRPIPRTADKSGGPVVCLCREHREGEGLRPAGVMHCFSGTVDHARRFAGLGFLVSFAGQLTFANAGKLRETAAKIPIECVMLETDCPFLAPQARRGERNEPAFIPFIAEELARIHKLAVADIARVTTQNAKWLFNLPEEDAGRIVYRIRDSVYVNLTERCSAACVFCLRHFTDYVKGHNLRIRNAEPSAEAVLAALRVEGIGTDSERKQEGQAATGPDGPPREVVFCGYGEPTLRLDVLKEVAAHVKKLGLQVRLDTNGHGDLINGRRIAPELVGLVDAVCVSLNAADAEEYERICRPSFGREAYDRVLEFARAARALLPKTEMTVVAYPGLNVQRCREIAASIDVPLRVRDYNVVG